MKTPGSSPEIFEENIKAATRLFTESSSALAKIYSNQFHLGFEMLSNFMNAGIRPSEENLQSGSEPFYSGLEMMQRSFRDFTDLSRKMMSTSIESYFSITNRSVKATGEMLNNMNKQMEAITETNMKLWTDMVRDAEKEIRKEDESRDGERKKSKTEK